MTSYCFNKNGSKKCIESVSTPMFVNDGNQRINKTVKNIGPNIELKLKKIKNGTVITGPGSAAGVIRDISNKEREEFRSIHLNTRNQVIGVETLSQGILDAAIIHPREVFKGAMLNNAKAIIVAHNHPSGDPTPSEEDREVCKRLKEVGEIVDMKVLDCLVIGKTDYVSLNEK